MLKQRFQQKLLQKLSPQQLQFIKLLQIPTVMLDARIKDELEENPALEDSNLINRSQEKPNEYDLDNEGELDDTKDDFSIEEYIQEDYNEKEYSTFEFDNDDENEEKDLPYAQVNSFYEMLQLQLSLLVLDDKKYHIAQYIIGTLDSDGYLRRPMVSLIDDISFIHNIDVTNKEVEEVLQIIHSFDPVGIGARTLQECLLLQLKKKAKQTKEITLAIDIISNHLEEFTKKHYDKLENSLNVSEQELKDAIQEILKLNPKPGDYSTDVNMKYLQVIPDFHIENNDSILFLTLNHRNAPELHVSKDYKELFKTYSVQSEKDKKLKEAVQFVKQKLDSAKWFIDAIKQRQYTLYTAMHEIMQFQYDFFVSGDDRKLKPMILKDIAERIDMDVSTVSRIASSKYVQTEFGTFLLKSFFSESISTDSGEDVSTREVKRILMDCIAEEDKHNPLSDDKLAEVLNSKGYNIARRTVAKYREQLNIPVARLRREL